MWIQECFLPTNGFFASVDLDHEQELIQHRLIETDLLLSQLFILKNKWQKGARSV